MSKTERKTLLLRGMPTGLVRQAKAAAAHRGETLTAIVAEALARSLEVESGPAGHADDLQRDMTWYRENRAALQRRYQGEYVAIIDTAVIDHDRDFSELADRVFARFGNRSIYMPRVQDAEPTVRIRSPRRARA